MLSRVNRKPIFLIALSIIALILLTVIQDLVIPETNLLQLLGGGLVLAAVTYMIVEQASSEKDKDEKKH